MSDRHKPATGVPPGVEQPDLIGSRSRSPLPLCRCKIGSLCLLAGYKTLAMSNGFVLTRRTLLAGGAVSLTPPLRAAVGQSDQPHTLGPGALSGWAMLELGSGRIAAVNADLRLPMCSSFKWLLAACILSRVDRNQEQLDRMLRFGVPDLLDYAPTTRAALTAAGGVSVAMPIVALCEAAVTLSDNTAANLLLGTIGGPASLTAWLRATGDGVTRLDRTEPALNRVPVGDARDTTTPIAMLGNLHRILFGMVLATASRDRLLEWMLHCQTGAARLPAGLPAGWRIAHKTGTWTVGPGHDPRDRAASGDVGVLFPPRGQPILIAAYTTGSERSQADIDRWFADLAHNAVARHRQQRRSSIGAR